MYSIVIQLRIRGVRRAERDIDNDKGVAGVLSIAHVGRHPRMALAGYGVHTADPSLLPALWEPKCTGWQGTTMVWQGYQRAGQGDDDRAPTYLQEWRVRIIGERPPQPS